MHDLKNFVVDSDQPGLTTITLDVPDHAMNVCNRSVMEELSEIVDDLEKLDASDVVVFRSGKDSGFLAGADVNAISELESASEIREVIEAGQEIYDRIESLAASTVAVIHGVCLGGGLEWALACNHRVAKKDDATKIGLPEIQLGLIPGWGGTQRLPRIAGLIQALPMILTGKQLRASQAFNCGLVDRMIAPEQWPDGINRFLAEVRQHTIGSTNSRRPFWKRCVESTAVGRGFVFRAAEKSIRSQAQHYPALNGALATVRAGYGDRRLGLQRERDEFVRLVQTETSRNLVNLFLSREKSRSQQTWSGISPDETAPIRKVGVVGAGVMGAGIGQLAALSGFDVVLQEVNEQAAEQGRSRVNDLIADIAKRKRWDERKIESLKSQIEVTCDQQRMSDCDLVIEAVIEREDIKDQVFSALDQQVSPTAILASNTSSLSVTRMSRATARPTQVAGLHFFNPVHRMELVEVVRADETDEATVARLVSFVKALGKTPVVTTDTPGFLVNRVLFPYLGEAVLMVIEGHDVATVDREIKRFGMPMGPMELLDQVGIDVAHHIAGSTERSGKEQAEVLQFFSAMVDAEMIGKKGGRGFYEYRDGKRVGATELPDSIPRSHRESAAGQYTDDGLTMTQRRLVYPMLTEAFRCYRESVVQFPWAIDLAMVLGTGFAPHRGGPLHVIDSIGPDKLIRNLNTLAATLGDRFTPPPALDEMAEQGQRVFEPTGSRALVGS